MARVQLMNLRNTTRARADIVGLWVALGCTFSCNQEPKGLPASQATQQDVILIVIDTLRGDSLARSHTPRIDALAEAGQQTLAWAPSTWTSPSTLSLLTGSHVREHGWDFPFPDKLEDGTRYPKLKGHRTLPQVMKEAGYTTLGAYANPMLSRKLGWERGFESWRRTSDFKMPQRLKKMLRKVKPDKPLFLYVHYLGPHQPLNPSPKAGARWEVDFEFLEQFDGGVKRKHIKNGSQYEKDQYYRAYHAEVEDSDRRLSKLWPLLGDRLDNALVIVTSDHGEMLGEHDVFGHGSHVWDQLTRVPLIVKGTDQTLPEIMSTTAIPDLITRSVGIEHAWPESMDTTWPLVSQREGMLAVSGDGALRGIWLDPDSRDVEVYNVHDDPEETARLVGIPDRAEVHMVRGLFEMTRPERQVKAEEGELDDETRSLLEELGYMGVEDDGPANP
jgi:hypothetical protein